MARVIVRKPIPWIMKSSPLVNSWTWETEHFVCLVLAEGLGEKKMYTWKVSDKSTGRPVPFESNTVANFDNAVEELLEVIGKSYDRILGYQEYAGNLATTFKVYDGRKINFADIIGHTVTIFAKNDDDPDNDHIFTGQLDVQHYDIVLQTEDGITTQIPPQYIKVINDEFGRINILDTLEDTGKISKNRRIFAEKWRKGCTGKPNFTGDKVVHGPGDQFCPIHLL